MELDLDGSGIKAEEVSQSVQCVFYIFELNLLGGVGVGLVQAIQN